MSPCPNAFDPHALTIWLPALARLEAASPWRRWLAQGDALIGGPGDALGRMSALFDADAQTLPVAALLREAVAGDAGDATWLCVDPAWVRPDPNGVRLMAWGRLGLTPSAADEFAASLAPLFAERGMALHASTPDHWQVRLPAHVPAPTFVPPEQAMGADLFEHLPAGAEGRPWRVLLNEAQVLLHQHPLNARRQAHGLPQVNTVWLWGAGSLPARWQTACAGAITRDTLLGALLRHAGVPTGADLPAALGPGWLLDLVDEPAAALDAMAGRLAPLRRWPWRMVTADSHGAVVKPWHRLRFWRSSHGTSA